MRIIKLLGYLTTYAIFVSTLLAQQSTQSTSLDRVAEINKQVELQLQTLEQIAARKQQLVAEQKKLQSSLNGLQKKEQEVVEGLARTSNERKEIEQQLLRLDSNQAALSSLLLLRMKALYISQADRANSGLLLVRSTISNTSGVPLSRKAYYLSRIWQSDKKNMQHLHELRDQIKVKESKLQQMIATQEGQRTLLTAQRKELAKQVAQRDNLLREAAKQQNAATLALAALRAQALRLETVISSLTNSNNGARGSLSTGGATSSILTSSVEGDGLNVRQGKLLPPVFGRLISGSLASDNPAATKRGWLIKAQEGAPVHCIAAGSVGFVGRMPWYGQVVIVNHGRRFYSLYARLAKSTVSKGEVIQQGATIGTVAGSRPGGEDNLYFELRLAGQPISPEKYVEKPSSGVSLAN